VNIEAGIISPYLKTVKGIKRGGKTLAITPKMQAIINCHPHTRLMAIFGWINMLFAHSFLTNAHLEYSAENGSLDHGDSDISHINPTKSEPIIEPQFKNTGTWAIGARTHATRKKAQLAVSIHVGLLKTSR